MVKRKRERFAECKTFTNLFQLGYFDLQDDFRLKGKWRELYFVNPNPLVLELGCGKGEYTTDLAKRCPEKNFIGIDSKGARLWRGCRRALEENLSNVAFIRTHIEQIERLFAPGEVNEIWITFPDPQPKKERKRLTSPRFLDHYRNILAHDAIIHLKTDNVMLHQYTLGIIKQQNHTLIYHTSDLYADASDIPATQIQTYYENIFLQQGMKITYIQFKLSETVFQPA